MPILVPLDGKRGRALVAHPPPIGHPVDHLDYEFGQVFGVG